jgi:hypothetical protein
MGFFDRLKKMLGGEGDAGEGSGAEAPSKGAGEDGPRSQGPARKRKGERPPLAQPAPPSATLDDALDARDAGDKEKARAILRSIDRGAGLRTVLRAAAALEAKDEDELGPLVASLAHAEAPWRLHLQLAAAMGDDSGAAQVERGKALGAPAWAVGWARAATAGDDEKRAALVDLLFADPGFARTVAARDLKIEGAHEDATAIARYASLDAGRVAIRRFGVDPVRALVARIDGGAPGAPR